MENSVKRPNVAFLLTSFAFVIVSMILGIFLGMQFQRNSTINTNNQNAVPNQIIVENSDESELEESEDLEIEEEVEPVVVEEQPAPIEMKRFNYELYNLSFEYPASLGEVTSANNGYEGNLVIRFSESKLLIELLSGAPLGDLSNGVENTEILFTESFTNKRAETVNVTVYTCIKSQPDWGICIWVPFANDGIVFYASRITSLEEAKEYIQTIKQIDSSLTSGVAAYFDRLRNQ